MLYKTILVHLNDKRRLEAMLGPAVHLARRNNAHLIGLHVYPNMPMPPIALAYGAQPLSSVMSAQREEVQALGACLRESDHQPAVRSRVAVTEGAARRARPRGPGPWLRSADLIVAGQADPNWELSAPMQNPNLSVGGS